MRIDPNATVVIVGGGVTGMCLAALLGANGYPVTLAESSDQRAALPDTTHDPQVFALSLASQRILAHVGAWQRLDPARVGPYARMHVWDALGSGSINFAASAIGEPALGYVVEQQALLLALEAVLAESEAVTWLRPATIAALVQHADAVELRTTSGDELNARMVIGADGSRSIVRQLAGIEAQVRPYQQRAVVSTVRLAAGHRHTAWQRFLAAGPVAILPMADKDLGTVVWSTSERHAEELLSLDEAGFCRALGLALEDRLGSIAACGPRHAFLLQRTQVARYVRDRVALIGDAAHQIHPLAGQGANLGLLDAAVLAECLGAARRDGSDPVRPRNLRRFERWRKVQNGLVQNLMDGFHLLFGQRPFPVRLLRNVGLAMTDECVPAKSWLIRQACGVGGHLPEVARAGRSG